MHISSPSSITIRWRTDSLCTSVVRYGVSDTNLNNSFLNIAQKIDHSVTISNLSANTTYYYAVGGATIMFTTGSNYYFKMPPVSNPNSEEIIRFWAVGDFSKQTIQQIQVRDAFINYTQGKYVDGWIMLGDNAYEGGFDNEYQAGLFNYYQSTILPHLPLFPVVGNHDYNNDSSFRKNHNIPYFTIFSFPIHGELGGIPSNNPMYYSYNYANVHFIQLDSYGFEYANGSYLSLADTLSPQVQWLKQDLQANTMPWTVVSFHHLPYGMGTHNTDVELDLVAIRTNLIPILERYNVDLVLNGHDHTYQRSHFIKNHYGLEASFDSMQHIRQLSNGRYDGSPNSCAYVKHQGYPNASDSGTVYVVAGSGSAAPWPPQTTWPHDAMSYSNYLNNGSLLLTIQGNALLGEWISNDTLDVVKDRFVMLKHVSGNTTLAASMGSQYTLQARWPNGGYIWSNGDTTRSLSFTFTQDTTFIVSDPFHCIQDTFNLSTSVGLESLEENNFSIYPNPSHGEIMIRSKKASPIDLRVYSLQGQEMFKTTCNDYNLRHSIYLPSEFIPGVYLVCITANHQRSYHKLVIER